MIKRRRLEVATIQMKLKRQFVTYPLCRLQEQIVRALAAQLMALNPRNKNGEANKIAEIMVAAKARMPFQICVNVQQMFKSRSRKNIVETRFPFHSLRREHVKR